MTELTVTVISPQWRLGMLTDELWRLPRDIGDQGWLVIDTGEDENRRQALLNAIGELYTTLRWAPGNALNEMEPCRYLFFAGFSGNRLFHTDFESDLLACNVKYFYRLTGATLVQWPVPGKEGRVT
jgi:hypothetical protein